MKNIVAIAVILLFSSLHTIARADYNDQWQKGNKYYAEKQYDSAAFYFEQIATLRPGNAEVYYNLGNTYYRLNKIALAVLNYERALRINPEYKEAKDNLVLTQNRISNHIVTADDIFFVKWWKSITRPDKATSWAIWAFVTFTIIMILMVLRRLRKGTFPIQLNGLLWIACGSFLLLAFASANNMEQHATAVVMQGDAPLMNNERKGKPVVLIPEGTTVKIRDDKENWLEISLPDGRTGWLQQNLVVKI
jgi:tetratricopeptide (TPR) repeat protein